jgi:hypothetical protein
MWLTLEYLGDLQWHAGDIAQAFSYSGPTSEPSTARILQVLSDFCARAYRYRAKAGQSASQP